MFRRPLLRLFPVLALLLGACHQTPPPAPITVAQSTALSWLRAHPQGKGGVLAVPAVRPHVEAAAGVAAFGDDTQALAWLLTPEPGVLQDAMRAHQLDVVAVSALGTPALEALVRAKTPVPAKLLTDEPGTPNVRPGLGYQQSLLYRLTALYGTGTTNTKCVDGLQFVGGSSVFADLGGRKTPEVQLYKRVAGAHITGKNLVGGAPVRLMTARIFAGQIFVFECHTRVGADGVLSMRWPYPSDGTADVKVNGPTWLWIGADKGPQDVHITVADVESGKDVVVAQ